MAGTSAQKKKPTPSSIQTNPAFAEATALYEKKDFEGAAALYRKLLAESPKDVSVWLNLGTALRKQEHFDASVACCRRALELSPGHTGALTNLGNALTDLDRIDEALSVHAEAVSRKRDDFILRRNYAIALREAGYFDEALAHFDAAAKMRPGDVDLLWERAMCLLYLGRYREGWDAFEIRWKLPQMRERGGKTPRWNGEKLKGKTLLVYEEQGFGDTILCSRYLPLIHALDAKIVLECKKPLHRLFSALPGIEQIAEPGKSDVPCDYQVPMMSLPRLFKTDLQSIPPPPKLQAADEVPPEAARLLAKGKGRIKIGIVWSGSTTFANNRKRAVAADRFMPLAAIRGVELYSLQKGPCEPELAACGGAGIVHELAPHMNDFAETAAVLKQLDLVIMTDSAVAHLAGSLGVPVWNLLCHRPYWLYLSDRRDCPWYSSMRLIRQPSPGDWDSVFTRVTQDLEKSIAVNRP